MQKGLEILLEHYQTHRHELWVQRSSEAKTPIAMSPWAQGLLSNVGVHIRENQRTVEMQLIESLSRKTSREYDDSSKLNSQERHKVPKDKSRNLVKAKYKKKYLVEINLVNNTK